MVSCVKAYGQFSLRANAGYSFKRHVSYHAKMVAAILHAFNNFTVAHCCGLDLHVAQSRALQRACVARWRDAECVRSGDFIFRMHAIDCDMAGGKFGAHGAPTSPRECSTV